MSGTIIVALISFFGTLVGTLGGIIASSRLTNYRIEQLEKKVDAHNISSSRIPIIEERLRSIDRRVFKIEKGDIKFEYFKVDNCKNHNDNFGYSKPAT